MKLSEKIVRLRKSRGMTQEEMAERCAVTRQSISKWEADIALPETEKLLMLSEIFGVPLGTLLRDERTLDAVRENPQCGPNAEKAMYEGILIKESPEDDAKDNWFADFKAGDRKYIVFHGKVPTYPIGNEAEKARVCAACREMGVPDEQMHWEE